MVVPLAQQPDLSKRHTAMALAVAVAVFALGTAPIGAQTGGPVADGDFTGTIGLEGGFRVVIPEGSLVLRAQGSGPLQFTLRDGAMSGTWSLAGTTILDGEFSQAGAQAGAGIIIEGTGTFSGSGPFGGPPGAYRMSGTFESENTATVTVAVAGISQSATETTSDTFDEALTDVIVLCDMVVGRWDLRVRQQIEAVGFDEFIRGYFSASTGIDATEQAGQIGDLLADVAGWAADEGGVLVESRSLYIGGALALLDRAQRLQAELAAPSPCPPDHRFATQLTLAVQDVLTSLVGRLPGITTSHIVALALGSGAIGSGSPVPGPAAELNDLMVSDVQGKWNALTSDPAVNLADLLDTARAAQMLGIAELGGAGLTPADVLLVFGDGS
jgi:hypothetical protein